MRHRERMARLNELMLSCEPRASHAPRPAGKRAGLEGKIARACSLLDDFSLTSPCPLPRGSGRMGRTGFARQRAGLQCPKPTRCEKETLRTCLFACRRDRMLQPRTASSGYADLSAGISNYRLQASSNASQMAIMMLATPLESPSLYTSGMPKRPASYRSLFGT